jgi:hypothetical protein
LLPRLPLAAREIEIRVELARLALELRAQQHEAIRLEQLPEIDVRQCARVRRIPRALEPVQLEGRERVVRRDLVDDENQAAGPRDAGELRDRQLRPLDVVKGPQRAAEIEGSALELEPRDVPLDEGRVRRGIRTRALEQLRHQVDTDDLADERGQRVGERTGARARIEGAFVPAEGDELADADGELAGAPLLLGGDPVSRCREPSARCVVRNRAPPLSS